MVGKMALQHFLRLSNPSRFISTSSKLLAAPTGQITPSDVLKRLEESHKDNYAKAASSVNAFTAFAEAKTKRWKEQYEIYYGKERDVVNFPMISQPEYCPKVRMGFIPDDWFQAFYNKTGVTGPYLFLWGGVLFALSKEYWVIDHDFIELLGAVGALVFIHKKFGYQITQALDKMTDEAEHNRIVQPIENVKKTAANTIEQVDVAISNLEVNKEIFQAKRENVELQLHAAYRQRLVDLHKSVKDRLDYQIQKDSIRREFQRTHMVDWIVNGVVKGFTPQQERETIAQCIQQLQGLAQKHAKV